VTSQINKYYVYDLSPPKSLIRFALASGLDVFAVSWRNPTPAQRDWRLDTYVGALEEAVDAAAAIAGAADVNIIGACSGGITCATLAGHLAHRGATKLHTLTLLVSLLDTESDGQLGRFASRDGVAAAKAQSAARGVLDGRDMARVFAWMRPNDLVWSYWVNNYVLGNPPPAFDILHWNADTTRLPARLHADFMDMYMDNPLPAPGRLVLRGTPIDLGTVRSDCYFVGGLTDHITPWQACYRSARLLGGQRRSVLSSSGHIQSILNPPGNAKARYAVADDPLPADPEALAASAEQRASSWWEDWRDWITARSGETRPAPAAPGDAAHPPLCPAPGVAARTAKASKPVSSNSGKTSFVSGTSGRIREGSALMKPIARSLPPSRKALPATSSIKAKSTRRAIRSAIAWPIWR
jgi:polyhydroxyalkanoate synthase